MPSPQSSHQAQPMRRLSRLVLFVIVTILLGTAIFSASSAHKAYRGKTGAVSENEPKPSISKNVASTKKVATERLEVNTPQLFSALLPQAPPAPETIETFASDCTTPKTSFNFGDVVCAKVSGGPPLSIYPRRIAWVDTDNNILQKVTVTTDPQTDLFMIPTVSTSTDYRGVWRVNDISTRASIRTSAFFGVSNPEQPAADLLIYNGSDSDGSITAGSNIEYVLWLANNGPDAAELVSVSNGTPSDTVFLSGQVSDPAWHCQFPAAGSGGGNTTCRVPSLAPGATAKITLVYQVNPGTTVGSTISDTAHISSSTADPRDDSNTPPPNDPSADPSNNTATSRTVVVGGAPENTCTLNCPVNLTVSANTTENNERGAHVTFSDAVATGTCGTVTASPASGSFFPVGNTVVSISSTEGDGSCSFTVTVVDNGNNPPTISCPANKEVNANSNCEAAVTLGTPSTSGDNVTVIGTRSDGKPMYNCDVNGNNCARRSPDDPFAAGITTVTWTAYSHDIPGPFPISDDEEAHRTGSASCTQTITVNDVEPPTISATPQTGSADASCQAPVPDFTATATVNDNCACSSSDDSESCAGREPITITQDPAPGTMVGLGPHTITLTANDGSSNNNGAGNTATTTTTFTVNDTTGPTISCPANITTNNEPGTCSANVNPGTATASDNCDANPTVSGARSDGQALSAPYPKGTTTITWTATDAAGNSSSCTQTITVNDTERPTITLNGANPQFVECHTSYTELGATAHDNCDGNFAATPSGSVNVDVPGNYTITYNASDAAGNAATPITRTVTVRDTIKPVITLNGAAVVTVECHTSYTDAGATASDACDTSVPVTTSGTVDVNTVGIYTLTYNATDDSGNAADPVTRTVTVVDTTAPTITLNSYAPSMWPPNHKYTTFQLTQFVTGASDSCNTSLGLTNVVIEKVTSDEIENGNGDGNTMNDIVIAANCKSVQLRSEREGGGDGRVYTITFKVTDASGNVGRATAKVVVPHIPGETPVDSGVQYTVNGTCP